MRPFTPAQIKLLETFADQAVIAIENVRLFKELQERNRDLTEAWSSRPRPAKSWASSASSPTDIQPVMDAVAESAARLCDSIDAQIYRVDGDVMRRVASHGSVPVPPPIADVMESITRGWVPGRAVVDRQTIHVHDIQAAESQAEYPLGQVYAERVGTRTILATPLLREGVPIGAILIRRLEVRPFSEKQIALLKTFADQAVIAIENVRLFKELQERNRDLTDALEQQTATSEILEVIASSPTDIQPVFQTILDNGVRLCEAQNGAVFRFDGEVFRAVVANNISAALQAYIESTPIRPGRESALRRVGLEKRTVHIPDMLADPECIVPEPYKEEGMRTNLAVPLLKENELIGAIAIHRHEVRPFTENQIRLLETFASQAVIAIENVRLFQELKEALEQQTATSEILGVIASSPTDIQPVLNVVAENAARLCEADDAIIRRLDGNVMPLVAHYGQIPPGGTDAPTVSPRDVVGRAIIGRQPIHLHDLAAAEVANEFPDSKFAQERSGARTFLTMPMLREGTPVGVINIRRQEVRPFSEKHVALLKTFADQAVIAIENVRLFKELNERNAELREALEHQTATSEVLSIISRSPTDVQPVLDAIVESAAKVCGIDDVALRLREGNAMIPQAHFGPIPLSMIRTEISIDEPHFRWMREHGALHIPDTRAQNDFPMVGSGGNSRTFLAAPLLQQGKLIGGLFARRTEVRPFSRPKSSCSKPSLTRRSSPLRTCGCSKNSTRRWSSRPRPARFWASSLARRRISSRCWIL